MSDEVWFVSRTYTRPTTWQGWLATIAFIGFIALMVLLAVAIASVLFAIGVVVLIVVAAFGFLNLVFRRSSPSRDVRRF